MEFGKSKNRITRQYELGEEKIKKVESEKDLGVLIIKEMSPYKHINEIVGETYNLLRNIRNAFSYTDEDMVKKLLVSLIRPRLWYAAVLWSPYTWKNIRKIERIQRAATKLAPTSSAFTYEKRLERLELPTLEQRRKRGDLLTIYKIMNNMELPDRINLLKRDRRDRRGHGLKLRKDNYKRDFKKNNFLHRVIDTYMERTGQRGGVCKVYTRL
ncbi:hypothetical protein E2C01_101828 [Portunus trituberculatus]|uniref:Endonuclease-reverse transcriptase n=1 Tax=Portunus trituberculatus TaxID=210409 RepID=A0A5B7KL09_PORTR|nr:hypothetical protein [Portunus trituberculatus]